MNSFTRIVLATVGLSLAIVALHVVVQQNSVRFLGRLDMVIQQSSTNCGPASLAFVLQKLGTHVDQDSLAKMAGTNAKGTSLLALARIAEDLGFISTGLRTDLSGLSTVPLPAIGVFKDHFVVITEVNRHYVTVADPLYGYVRYGTRSFERVWLGQVLTLQRRDYVCLRSCP